MQIRSNLAAVITRERCKEATEFIEMKRNNFHVEAITRIHNEPAGELQDSKFGVVPFAGKEND